MTSHTGTTDKDYDVVSTLYHSLSGAESCKTFIEDAEKAGDSELAGFFKETLETYRSIAEKAKRLTASRLT